MGAQPPDREGNNRDHSRQKKHAEKDLKEHSLLLLEKWEERRMNPLTSSWSKQGNKKKDDEKEGDETSEASSPASRVRDGGQCFD